MIELNDVIGKQVTINSSGDIQMESKWRKYTSDDLFTIEGQTKGGLYILKDKDGVIVQLPKKNINFRKNNYDIETVTKTKTYNTTTIHLDGNDYDLKLLYHFCAAIDKKDIRYIGYGLLGKFLNNNDIIKVNFSKSEPDNFVLDKNWTSFKTKINELWESTQQ